MVPGEVLDRLLARAFTSGVLARSAARRPSCTSSSLTPSARFRNTWSLYEACACGAAAGAARAGSLGVPSIPAIRRLPKWPGEPEATIACRLAPVTGQRSPEAPWRESTVLTGMVEAQFVAIRVA